MGLGNIDVRPADYSTPVIRGMESGVRMGETMRKAENEQQDRARRDQARNAFGRAWTSGDPAQMHQAIGMFPEYAGIAQEQLGIRNEQQRKDMGSFALNMRALIDAGDVESLKGLINNNANVLKPLGPDAATRFLAGADDPARLSNLRNLADAIAAASVTSSEALRHGEATQRLMFDQMREYANLEYRYAALEQRLKEAEARNKTTERGQDLRHEGALAAIEGRRTDAEAATAAKQSEGLAKKRDDATKSTRAMAEQVRIANRLLEHNRDSAESFVSNGTGWMFGRMLAPGDDGQIVRSLLEQVKSSGFLANVEKLKGTGALSDSEGKRLEAMIGSLDPSNNEGVLVKNLLEIQEQTLRLFDAAKKDAQRDGYSIDGLDKQINDQARRLIAWYGNSGESIPEFLVDLIAPANETRPLGELPQ